MFHKCSQSVLCLNYLIGLSFKQKNIFTTRTKQFQDNVLRTKMKCGWTQVATRSDFATLLQHASAKRLPITYVEGFPVIVIKCLKFTVQSNSANKRKRNAFCALCFVQINRTLRQSWWCWTSQYLDAQIVWILDVVCLKCLWTTVFSSPYLMSISAPHESSISVLGDRIVCIVRWLKHGSFLCP